MTELRWRLIRDAPAAGPLNMARDHALARCLGPGEAVLRLYGWQCPTVSFGRNEPARGHGSRDADGGPAFVRRPTGGRAVLHDQEVTYAVVLADRAWGGPREALRRIHDGLVRGLRGLGVSAEVKGEGGSVLRPDAGPCFRAAAPGEVAVGGRKLVGSAQVRMDGRLLQHGSVLIRGDQDLLARLRGEEPGSLDRPATIEGTTGRGFSAPEVAAELARGARLAWGGGWREAQYRAGEVEEVERLLAERYQRDEWTWRR